MSQCDSILGTDPATAVVFAVHEQLLGYASTAFSIAVGEIADLNAFDPKPYQFQVSYNLDATLFGFTPPAPPDDRGKIEYNPNTELPALPTPIAAPSFTPDPVPTFTAATPVPALPPAPIANIPAVPQAPLLADIVLPDAPHPTLPDAPELRQITIPAAPDITLPTFDAVAPVRNFDVPNFDFDYTPVAYSDGLLDAVKARLATMLQGGTGLPLAIEQALFDRAAAREDGNDAQALMEAAEDFSSRGFPEPNGIFVRRMQQIRQNSRNARAGINRDLAIRVADIDLENLRFSVTQGVALETVLIDSHFRLQGLSLEAAKFGADLAVRVLDARIAILNADAQVFQIRASVFRDLIQAALAELDIFRAKIEAQKLIGEINAQDVALYEAKLRAVDTMIGIYKAQIDGQNAIAANNTSRVQAFNGLVSARSETIRGEGFKFDQYKTRIEAEKTKGDIYETSARAFSARVQAYSSMEQTKLEAGRYEIARGQAQIDQWKAQVQAVLERLNADKVAVETKIELLRYDLAKYTADTNIEQIRSDVNARRFTLALEKERATVDTALKNVELLIDQNEKIYGLLLEAQRTAATVAAQLTGSSLSALNSSASIGHSSSEGRSCSTSISVGQSDF